MNKDILIEKFQRYFRDPVTNKEILERGDKGVICKNLRRAISMLTGSRIDTSSTEFDEELENAVVEFQKENRHRVADGRVGPGTRALITRLLLAQSDASIFLRLMDPRGQGIVSVFLSYARADTVTVNKIDQWLRDQGVRVIRDQSWFFAGLSIPDNIRYAIAQSDKVICMYSANSKDRDWPQLERQIAEQVEQRMHDSILIYVKLDSTELPQHDPNRVAISAKGRRLEDVGYDLLRSISGKDLPTRRYEYDPDELL